MRSWCRSDVFGLQRALIASCSCTVIPVAGGLYYGGAGIGPAVIGLRVAPAANILALAYTGSILGRDLMLARVVSAHLTAFVMGGVMMAAFRREEQALGANPATGDAQPTSRVIARADFILIALLLVNLLAPNDLAQQGPYLHKVMIWTAAGVLVGVIGAMLPPAWIVRWLTATFSRRSCAFTAQAKASPTPASSRPTRPSTRRWPPRTTPSSADRSRRWRQCSPSTRRRGFASASIARRG